MTHTQQFRRLAHSRMDPSQVQDSGASGSESSAKERGQQHWKPLGDLTGLKEIKKLPKADSLTTSNNTSWPKGDSLCPICTFSKSLDALHKHRGDCTAKNLQLCGTQPGLEGFWRPSVPGADFLPSLSPVFQGGEREQ